MCTTFVRAQWRQSAYAIKGIGKNKRDVTVLHPFLHFGRFCGGTLRNLCFRHLIYAKNENKSPKNLIEFKKSNTICDSWQMHVSNAAYTTEFGGSSSVSFPTKQFSGRLAKVVKNHRNIYATWNWLQISVSERPVKVWNLVSEAFTRLSISWAHRTCTDGLSRLRISLYKEHIVNITLFHG